MMRLLSIGLLLFAGLQVERPEVAGPENGEERRPNVLFLAIDDLNDWITPLGGHPQARTPNLERLAAMGTTFTNAHCAAPACNPSRVAVLTGLRPATSGVYFNLSDWRAALPQVVTIPELFGRSGYTVVAAGKITHHRDLSLWQHHLPIAPGRLDKVPKERVGHLEWGRLDIEDADTYDARIVDRIERFLAADHERPFFLACGFVRPHLPWNVPARFFEEHPLEAIALPPAPPDDLDDVPAAGRTMRLAEGDDHSVVSAKGAAPEAVQAYLAAVSFLDHQLGRVLDAVAKRSDAENTIIVLWSDHGFHLGEKQHWRKFTLWEESTRVPLLLAGPGVPRGVERPQPVELVSLYRTLTELCGLDLPHEPEGASLVPLLESAEAPWRRPALTTNGPGNHAVRDAHWRLVQYADGSRELYDHRIDPHEWNNLAGSLESKAIEDALAEWIPTREAEPAPTVRRRGR